MFGDGNGGATGTSRLGSGSAPIASPGLRYGAWDGSPPAAVKFNLAEYWRLALKHRLLIIAVFVACIAVGAIVTLLMTPKYSATTTLQIDREAARVLNVDDTTPRESMIQGEEFFQTQYGLLRSRSLAERVVDSEGLATSDAFLEAMDVTPTDDEGDTAAESARKRRELVIGTLQKNLSIGPVRGSRLVMVTYTSPNPDLSARIANSFATNFIQANLDRKYESSVYAREFLEDRIAQTKGTLEAAERQLVAYATQQQIVNVREGEGANPGETQSLVANNLATLNEAMSQATAARIAAEQKWRQVQRSPALSLPDVFQNPTIQRLVEERARRQAEYEQKLGVYQPDYPEMAQLKAQVDELDAQISTVASEIRQSVRNQYTVAANQENALRAQVRGLTGDVLDLRDRSIQYNILQREVDTSRTLYDGLLQRYKEVSVTGVMSTNNVSVVDQAEAPNRPSSPRMLLNLLIAALLGLGLGVLAAFVLEALDETLATPDDVESKLGAAVLGAVPRLDKQTTPAEALADLRSGFSEAYYSLMTALQFSTPNGAPQSLLVTSSRPAEGKSTTAFALAQSLARSGRRVLLVDADLRNPSMHRIVGVDNDRGMSNLLSGALGLASVLHDTKTAGMQFIPCGPLPPNPAELLAGDRVAAFLQEALTSFDHIVFDGPPVLGFADAPLLASTVGGTLFVLESRGTRRGQARGALKRLHVGTAKVLGVVLTKFDARTTSYGGYDYSYDYAYGPETSSAKGRRR